METILIMSSPVVQKGENIETQVIPITTSGFRASVKGGGEMEVLKIWRKKLCLICENKPRLLSTLCMIEHQQAVGHLLKENNIT